MAHARRRLIILSLGMAVTVGLADAAAVSETAAPPAAPVAAGSRLLDAAAIEVVAALAQDPAPAAPAPTRKRNARRGAVRGALIGAGVGAGAAIAFAAAYGNNEGGGFCGACLATWGSAVVGAGAAIGAGVGAAIGASTPSRQPGPPLGRPDRPLGRRRGVAFTVQF